MIPYLLDTNACVGVLRGRQQLVQRVNACPGADLFLCSVVKAELVRGTLRTGRPGAKKSRENNFASDNYSSQPVWPKLFLHDS